MLKTTILFIINPVSGGKNKSKISRLIDTFLDKSKFSANFCFTEYVGHAIELAEEAAQKNFDIITAVGGDGTINEVGTVVMKYNKILAVIPQGSGNGLARFLKIPMNPSKAIQLINRYEVNRIDAGTVNGRCFFNMAGVGFDAHISAAFVNNKTRGLKGYVNTVLKELRNYKSQEYILTIDEVVYHKKAFAVSIANSSQYGNNVFISPASSATDGLLDVCIIKSFPLYKLPVLIYQMVRATTDRSKLVEIVRGKQIKITRLKEGPIHIDGEPFFMGTTIEIEIIPMALRVIAAGK